VAANDDKKHVEDVFDNIFFANAWLYGFCSCCLFCLLQPFIGLWVGTDFLLNEVTVILIVFIFYITGMRKTVILFKDASGLFWYDRYKPLFECTLNLVVSLLLVKKLGLTGVLIGTICGSLLVSFWYEAYVLFKYMFQKSIVKYLLLQVKNMTIAVLITLLCYYFSSFISNSILGFCLKMMICLTLPNVIYFIIWHKKKEFIYFKSIVLSYRDKLRK
jgi:O-antigen/teichoic acid export membrane protein